MNFRNLIAGAAVVLLCGGVGVCVAQEAPAAPAAAPEAASSPAPASAPAAKSKHHAKHHARHHGHHRRGKQSAQKEFTEQQLQEMQTQPPSK